MHKNIISWKKFKDLSGYFNIDKIQKNFKI